MLDDPTLFPIVLAASVALALVVGAVIGRRTGATQKRIASLQAQVEAIGREREIAEAAAESAKHETARVRSELREYRDGVVAHFTGTSGLLRELTHQYRAVYEHLTEGATTLCPKGSIDQLEALRTEKLPEVGSATEPAARPATAAPRPADSAKAGAAPPSARPAAPDGPAPTKPPAPSAGAPPPPGA